ncbi:transglycosylase [Bacillus albus]|uniref:transglycosylase n=1 Tax=Bacillus albus TaxID=2026189 RepID=UPI00101EB297|nr:transglycosylase [Bacillus albus]
MRKRTIVTCDKCSGSFVFKPFKRKLSDGIEMHYIKCRHCHKETVSYYTDGNIRQQMKVNEVKRKELQQRMVNAESKEEIEGYVEQINKLSEDVGVQMDQLKVRIEK